MMVVVQNLGFSMFETLQNKISQRSAIRYPVLAKNDVFEYPSSLMNLKM